MKTVGIVLLFGLCAVIGMRLGAKKTERLFTVRALRKDLQLFSERIAAGRGTLTEIASENGALFELIGSYLAALSGGETESAAAERASDGFKKGSAEGAGLCMFFTGLSSANRSDLIRRTDALSVALERAENEAETEAKQARVLRVSGVLVGAGIAILLL